MGTEVFALVLIASVYTAWWIGYSRGWNKGFGDAEKIYSESAEARAGLYREAYMDMSAKYATLLKQQGSV